MKLNVGRNDLYSTTVQLERIDVLQKYVDSALQNVVHTDLKNKTVALFDKYIQTTLPEYKLSDWKHKVDSWVNRFNQDEMEYHTHNGAMLSAVVYLINESDGGDITFYDPRHFAARGYDLKFRSLFDPIRYKPEAGDVLIFPSYLYHAVSSTRGLRISIPFDLYLFNNK